MMKLKCAFTCTNLCMYMHKLTCAFHLYLLCQHPTPNFSHHRYGKNGSLRAGENIFDPHFHPSGIDEGAEQVYVYKMERATNITMLQNIFGCPYLVVDGISVPNSHVDFMILYVYLI
jgi:hypothetical protein